MVAGPDRYAGVMGVTVKIWQADFFDNSDDPSPSRSMTIAANSEDEAVEKAAAQIGDASHVEFSRTISVVTTPRGRAKATKRKPER
jgi:hypothetical protein